jgi:hypothetical protein
MLPSMVKLLDQVPVLHVLKFTAEFWELFDRPDVYGVWHSTTDASISWLLLMNVMNTATQV